MALDSQGTAPDARSDRPSPELNPLLNPTLGRNLSRWARVYFENPPASRERAVVELLRELEARPGSTDLVPSVDSTDMREASTPRPASTLVSCWKCGHPRESTERFCGMCGSLLQFDQTSSEQQIPQAPPANAALRDGQEDSQPVTAAEPVFPTLTLFPNLYGTQQEPPMDSNGSSDIQWLRAKNLTAAQSPASRRRVWYLLAAFGVVLTGVSLNIQLRPGHHSPSGHGEPAELPAPPDPRPASQLQTGSSSSASAETASQNSGAASRLLPKPSAAPGLARSALDVIRKTGKIESLPATPTGAQSATVNAASEANSANGSIELAMAEDYLMGKNTSRNSEEAAKLLWKAVAKENTTAALLLSDLYKAGDGVPKSCDQARLLLTAAARKNVAEATARLRALETSGCP